MEKFFVTEGCDYGRSIFLAGPTAKEEQNLQEWRYQALDYLEAKGWGGAVYLPLWRRGPVPTKTQVEWEMAQLHRSTAILFWIPRSLQLLGLRTNVEWGHFMSSDKCVLGFPSDALHMGSLLQDARRWEIPVAHTLEETVAEAIEVARAPETVALKRRFLRDHRFLEKTE